MIVPVGRGAAAELGFESFRTTWEGGAAGRPLGVRGIRRLWSRSRLQAVRTRPRAVESGLVLWVDAAVENKSVQVGLATATRCKTVVEEANAAGKGEDSKVLKNERWSHWCRLRTRMRCDAKKCQSRVRDLFLRSKATTTI
jgi:hypothetical protein